MMKILLKNQLKILMNTMRTQRWQNTLGFIVVIGIVGYLLYILSIFVWLISGQVTPSILENLLSFSFLTLIGLIILMGLPQVFKSLYSGSDLEMLFTMPIPTRYIFWVRYIQSYFGTPLFAYIMLAVPMIIFGLAVKAPFLYFITALLALFAVTIIGLSVIFLLNLLLIQVMPPSRANEFITVVSVLSGIIVYLIIILPNMSGDESMTDRILSGLPALPKWVPVSWGSSAISQAFQGELAAFLPLAMLLLLAIILMILATMLVERGFRTGWIRLSERSSKKRTQRSRKGTFAKLHHPIIAVGKKEWYTIKRDLREWLTLLPILFFIVFGVIGFMTGGGELNISEMRSYNDISWPIAQIILLFLFSLANGMIASSSIGREGPNLWITQVIPLSGRQISYGKFWSSWLLPLIIISVVEVVATFFLGWSIIQLITGIILKAIATTGMTAMGLWFGTIGAKYNPTNPQQRLSFGASFILFILTYIYLIIIAIPTSYVLLPEIALTNIPLEHEMSGFLGVLATIALFIIKLKVNYSIIAIICGIIVLTGLALGISHLFLSLSSSRIERGLKIDIVSQSSTRALRRPRGKGGLGGGLL